MDKLFTVLFAILFVDIVFVAGAPQEAKSHVYKTSNNILSIDADVDWWKTAIIYQIYPRSFKDSNNDGIGDLQGVIEKLDYLKETGVDAIWLNPIFKSPQVDTGYDISDYRDIDPVYGTLDDLRQLIDEAHQLNIKILLDYVPNHTSDQHEWFQASSNGDSEYADYYIWKNATYVDGERTPPNNWISIFSGPAWEWNEGRQQYYLHQFATGQPDLNYRNPVVVEEMKDVLRYWLNFGADGFRMDAVMTLFEDASLQDEPESGNPGLTPSDHDYLTHIYTLDQPESFDMLYQWREVIDQFNRENNTYTRIMITEGNANADMIRLFYGNDNGSRLGAHFTFNFITFFDQLHYNFTGFDLLWSIENWMNAVPSWGTNNWLLGNHDNARVSTRLGVENIDGLNMVVAILPGAQITYQGEEIGQENGNVTCEEGTDPQAIKNCSTFATTSRDFERTPFQWDNSTNAGFNDGAKTWLPVSEKYLDTNLAKQNIPDINSHYNIYKQMLKLKQEFDSTAIKDQVITDWDAGNVLCIQRITDNANYLIFYNVGDTEALISKRVNFCSTCDDCMTVAARSLNSEYLLGDKFNVSQPLKPREVILNKVVL